MTDASIIALTRDALLLMVLASLPPIGAAAAVGLVMGLFQAATQIQESTLSVVPRLCAAVLALVLTAPWTAGQLTRFSTQLLLTLAEVGR
jgi:flagellar biosynthesis protein FliQ